jgi:hypothetical protein
MEIANFRRGCLAIIQCLALENCIHKLILSDKLDVLLWRHTSHIGSDLIKLRDE